MGKTERPEELELLAVQVCPTQMLTCKLRRLQDGISFNHCLTATSRDTLSKKHPAKPIQCSDSQAKEMIVLILSHSFRVVCS